MITESAKEKTAAMTAATSVADYLFLVLSWGTVPIVSSWRFCLQDIDVVILVRGPRTGAQRSTKGGTRSLTVSLADSCVSATHAELRRSGAQWLLIDRNSRNGTLRNGESVARVALADGDTIEVGQSMLLLRAGMPTAGEPRDDTQTLSSAADRIFTTTMRPDLSMKFAGLQTIAATKIEVLIQGDTGTGKEGAARAVHEWSGRSGPFVAINCSALSATLLESELFGHVRGAFTGATANRAGLVSAADGGTLFLDEIGDLPLPAQGAVLRVLQESEVLPVGGNRPRRVDIRLVSATHRNLYAMTEQKTFRRDLYARITGHVFSLPPLCERREDLGLLVGSILRRHGAPPGTTLSKAAAKALMRYPWPYNVRELDKCLAAALTLSRGGPIGVQHLPDALRAAAAALPTSETPEETRERGPDQLQSLLSKHKGNVAAVAHEMHYSPTHVRRLIKRHGINLGAHRH